jgi:DNA polymerase-3 subunit delta'
VQHESQIDTLPGLADHPHARAALAGALGPAGRPSHAYLFHGPPGSGKRAVAEAFAAALLAGSGEAAAVAERVARRTHPDLTWVTPSGAAEMLVSDVDEAVIAAATRTPFESARRVFVIERAETMNDQAANRMLKTLEEPPPFVHLVLLCDRPEDLLPTIGSRCRRVRFDPPSSERIAARLEHKGVPAATAAACAGLALGDATLAGDLATEDGQRLRTAAERYIRNAIGANEHQPADKPWAGLLEAAKAAGDRAADGVKSAVAEELEVVPAKERRRHEREAADRIRRAERRERTRTLDLGLRLAGLWLRDAACLAEGLPELVYASDRVEELTADAEGRSGADMRSGVELVQDTRRRLALNVSEELALEALAYRLEDRLAPAATPR